MARNKSLFDGFDDIEPEETKPAKKEKPEKAKPAKKTKPTKLKKPAKLDKQATPMKKATSSDTPDNDTQDEFDELLKTDETKRSKKPIFIALGAVAGVSAIVGSFMLGNSIGVNSLDGRLMKSATGVTAVDDVLSAIDESQNSTITALQDELAKYATGASTEMRADMGAQAVAHSQAIATYLRPAQIFLGDIASGTPLDQAKLKLSTDDTQYLSDASQDAFVKAGTEFAESMRAAGAKTVKLETATPVTGWMEACDGDKCVYKFDMPMKLSGDGLADAVVTATGHATVVDQEVTGVTIEGWTMLDEFMVKRAKTMASEDVSASPAADAPASDAPAGAPVDTSAEQPATDAPAADAPAAPAEQPAADAPAEPQPAQQ